MPAREGHVTLAAQLPAGQSVVGMSEQPEQSEEAEARPFDIEEARARYRRMMRGRVMRVLLVLTMLVLLFSWAYAGTAALATDVEGLPGHDLSVGKARCVNCHTQRIQGAPAFNHSFAPTCGFCHRQALPQQGANPLLKP